MTETNTHVHYRPGGAVFDAACRCVDQAAWPVGAARQTPLANPGPLHEARNPPALTEPRQRQVRLWLEVLRGHARAVTARAVRAARRPARRGAALARGAWALARTVALVIVTVVAALGNGAQVAGVTIASWAAWEVDPLAGKIVLAAGLLFLGGAIARVAKEVRNGHR